MTHHRQPPRERTFQGPAAVLILFAVLAAPALAQSGPSLSVTAVAPGAALNSNVTYTVTVINNGPGSATGVTVTAILPSGFPFVPAGSSPTCSDNSGTVSCAVGGLGAGASTNVIIVATAASAGTKKAVFGVVGNEGDPNVADNSTVVTTTISCPTVTVSPATLPGGLVGSAYNQPLTATGGTAPYTFARQSGTLPAGVNLSGAGVLGGTPTSANLYTFTVLATDAAGCTGTRSYTVNICGTITVNPATLPAGWIGVGYNATLTATGGTGPYTFTRTSGSLPPGLTLASGGGLTGVPTAVGSYPFGVTAADSRGCVGTRNYTITVATCSAITVGPATLPGATVGVAYSQTLTGSGGAAPYTFSLASGTLPAGLTLTGAVLSGVPSAAGTATFTIRATDANGCSGTQTYSVVTSLAGFRFYTVAPCRALDTRDPAGTYGGPALSAGGTRTFPLAGRCAIPSNAKAVAINVTVVGGPTPGTLIVYPSSLALAPNTSVLTFLAGDVLASSAWIAAAQDGTSGIAIKNTSTSPANVLVDVVGFFQ
jgi:uncharacterized repeat protein (TIGR01451 family)